MSYTQKIDEWLAGLLPDLDSASDVNAEIKAKLLESYRNGQRDCPKCNPRPARVRKPVAR